MSTSRVSITCVDRHAVDEHVEHRALDRVRVQALRHRQVALRVEVDEQHLEALLRERDAEVQRGRRLRDAALLVRERDHLCLPRRDARSQGECSGRGRRRARPMCKRISVRLSSFLPPPPEVS